MKVVLLLYLEPDSEITNVVLSSLSTFSQIATEGLLYPSTLATSLPTNQGSPLITIVLTSPKRSSFENLNFHIHSKLSIINYQLSISECFAWAHKRKAPATRFPSDCECKTTTKKALHDRNATKCHQLPRNATKCYECHPHMFL